MSTNEQKTLSTDTKRVASQTLKSRAAAATGAVLGAAALAVSGTVTAPAFAAPSDQQSTDAGAAWDEQAFRGEVEVIRDNETDQDVIDGVVFDDKNKNSTQDEDEPGVEGVTVSNGRDTTTTDANGRYELPAYENMTVFVTQPAGYQVPVDEQNIAQFHYHHLPEGSPELEHGGIEPTGALPEKVNFPLAQDENAASSLQECVIGGDIQTYTEEEVEFARDGAFTDLANRSGYESCGALFVGDNVGDRPDLFPGIQELSSMINGPARFLPGNHDPDFDATDQDHAFDSYRAALGPEYYSYDVGDAHFVALNNVEYPYEGDTLYDGAIDDEQMEWLRQDIAQVPEDKLIVIATHIPLLGFADQGINQHQTEQVQEIHDLMEGREAISLAGHVHAIENMREGDSIQGWQEQFGVDELPFLHITVGAISGDWYNGRMLDGGYPTAVQRDGAYPGVLTLDIDGNQVTERFTVTGDDGSHQMNLGLNTPAYRDWFDENADNAGNAEPFEDPDVVTQNEVAETWLTTNFFMGATGSTVEVALDGGEPVEAVRTQEMSGEEQHVGSEYSDPTATQEQLVHGGSIADRSSHLWRFALPEDLEPGVHTAEVTATDVHGQVFTDTYEFEVADENGDGPGTDGDIPVEADIPGLPGSDDSDGDDDAGNLVLSVHEGTVEMDEQRHAGDRLRAYGSLPTVDVTDTRVNGDGWEVSGQSSDLVSEAATLEANHLGWKPHVESSSNGAAPGSAATSHMSGGDGLAAPQVLGSGDAETRLGTTELGADLELEVPVDTESGTYEGALSVSLFPVD